MAELIEMPFGLWTWMGPKKDVLHRGAHWRNLQIRLHHPCRAAMQPFRQITMTSCYYYYQCSKI